MKPWIGLLTSAILFFFFQRSSCCEPFQGSPQVCQTFYGSGTLISVPAASTQAEIASNQSANADLLQFVSDQKCRLGLTKLLCGNFFQTCFPASLTPRKLCQSFCQSVVSDCLSALPASVLPNCSETDSNGQSRYSTGTEMVTVNGTSIAVPCLADLIPVTNVTTPVSCQLPFVSTDSGGCAIRCPVPIFSNKGYSAQKETAKIGGMISIACFSLTFFILALIPERWKFPANLAAFLLIAGANSVLMVSVGFGYTAYACKNRWTAESQKSGDRWCTFIGIWHIQSILSSVTWYVIVLVNMLGTVYQIEFFAKRPITLQVVYHCVGWLLPVIPIIVAVSAEKIVGGTFACTVDGNEDNGQWFDGLVWGPFGTLVGIGLVIKALIVYRLAKTVGLEMLSSNRWRRLLIFLIFFAYLSIFTISIRIYTRIRTDAVAKDLTNWALCVSSGQSGCRQRKVFSTVPNIMGHINATILGVLALFLFGITRENLNAIGDRFEISFLSSSTLSTSANRVAPRTPGSASKNSITPQTSTFINAKSTEEPFDNM